MNYQRPAIEELAPVAVFLNPFLIETAKPTEQIDWRVRKIKEFIDTKNGVTGSDFDEICEQLNLHISGTYAAQLFKESIAIGWREYAASRTPRSPQSDPGPKKMFSAQQLRY